jgi:hypothetical protein
LRWKAADFDRLVNDGIEIKSAQRG